jgi:hypothetical protein
MNRFHIIGVLVALLAAPLPMVAETSEAAANTAAVPFTLNSPDVADGKTIGADHVFNGFGCIGKNISPALAWSNAPDETKSFAVTVYDPDAPTGSGWWHWILYNIPADTSETPRDINEWLMRVKLREGVWTHGRNDYGTHNFGGPCPPVGDTPHRYVFTVFALNVERLDVPVDASAALIGFNLNAHAIAKAGFTATYGR